MAKFKVRFKKSVAKDLKSISKKDVSRILRKIDQVAENPRARGCIKLAGQDLYRVRQGLYRIVYEIRDDVLVVNVVRVAHRSTVYKNT